ncbi:LysR family transcriptional regulator [Pigmentiphaga sp. NML080357]|uniref:LysR substrate-binding domain-containing protein n=1 Tax=Pigmentiphaga sp. NML080357 TaxID=2008675 RepID=UPI000B4114FF|nr:LysR substrate-binding domain-containing protein [Pigmentiphaga sp. NML080357]OVZ57579.1 LysR family transcriptional regulator [Pigmentiphaga sp. NML080357]
MRDAFKIPQLRQFVIAASRQSLRAAAEETHRTQAAVTLAMQNLEAQVGASLFEHGHQARLTPLGEAVLPLLQELLALHDRVQNEVSLLAAGEQGSIALAVMPSLAEEWLPLMLRRFAASYPGVSLRIADVSSPQVGPLVASGEAQLGIAGLTGEIAGLDCTPVARDTFGVVCARGHPLARQHRSVPWRLLRGEPLIENTTFHALREHRLGTLLDRPHMVIKNRTSLIAAVKAGLGITVLPALAQPAPEHDLAFIPLTAPRIERRVGVLRSAGRSLSPAAAHMHALMLDSLRDFARSKGAQPV